MSVSKTIDTALVLKASGAETSGTDGAGTALDMGGAWGLITAICDVTVVAGSPVPTKLDLDIEGSHDNISWTPVARFPQISGVGRYLVPLFKGEAADRGFLSTAVAAFRQNPRYLRKKSTVTAGSSDSITFAVHLSA